ncbi:hypothetical protein DPMN_179045 [Dreissena polymorpha]|uniref:Uncharacterized protein n=1 Tax=Dreissena polymorpha TaxID=45954 RepID=A0A9D4EC26_DREPO|nr:hypothetical protein DPMN_179045 [Dreissena polymorpha]
MDAVMVVLVLVLVVMMLVVEIVVGLVLEMVVMVVEMFAELVVDGREGETLQCFKYFFFLGVPSLQPREPPTNQPRM